MSAPAAHAQSASSPSVGIERDAPAARWARLLGALGVPASALGALGGIHSACHAACAALVASLAVAGVSLAGMPLAFLLDPSLVLALSSAGIVSVGLSLALYRSQRRLGMGGGRVRLALLAVFGVLSVVSLALGVRDTLAGGGAPPSGTLALVPARQEKEAGDLDVAVRYEGRFPDGLRFAVTMDTSDMGAPPLSGYDLGARSTLVLRGRELPARSWKVLEGGHMGHHLKGRLVFPAVAGGRPVLAPGMRVALVLRGLAAGELRFAWRVRSAPS